MAYLITVDDFKMEYLIPNTKDMNSRVVAELNQYIDKYAKLLMRHVLGLDQYNELDTLLDNGILPDTDTSKWKLFVYGDSENWQGIASVLVPYVYYHYVSDQASYWSGVGDVKANAKNAFSVNQTQRVTHAWNDFARNYNYGLLPFFKANESDFEERCYLHFHIKNQFGL